MTKITLIVPDHIDIIRGSRNAQITREVLTPQNLLKVLCDRSDYHESYYFRDEAQVKILSIAKQHR